jgi:hypothetical protein
MHACIRVPHVPTLTAANHHMEITIQTPLPDYCEPLRIVTAADDILAISERLGIQRIIGNCAHKLDGLVNRCKGSSDIFVCDVGHYQRIIAGFLLVYREGRSEPYISRLLFFRCPEEKITESLLETVLTFTEEYAVKLIESTGGCTSFVGGPLS